MRRFKKIKGTLGTDWLKKYDGKFHTGNLMLESMSNPDLLSDEDQCMYPERDFDEEEMRSKYLKAFTESVKTLTLRQKQVVNAIQNLTQEEAANTLGISRTTLAVTLLQIRKKLNKNINIYLKEQQSIEETNL